MPRTTDDNTAVFRDRREAGRRLAGELAGYAGRDDVVVLALPRGGVPVARQIAEALGAPLDVLVVRKLGAPFQPELALGAVATGGIRVLNEELWSQVRVPREVLEEVTAREREELLRRERTYRGDREPLDVRGRIVVLVDDGVATGSTLKAAIRALKEREPARIVVAVPVAAADSAAGLEREVDELVCLLRPRAFFGVSQWYERFPQLSDEDVRRLLSGERSGDG